MKYVHISLKKPTEFALGGVGVFQKYLQRAIPDMQLIAWSDFPDAKEYADRPDYEKANILNMYLLRQGIVDRNMTVIVDGYWGFGLPGEVARLVSVVHGSYFGRLLESQVHPWGEYVGMDHVDAQREMWDDRDTEVVCVSRECVNELRTMGVEKDLQVIYHGVDLDVYRPMPEVEKTCMMHIATSNRKGHDILTYMHQINETLLIEFMSEHSGDPEKKAARFNEAYFLVAPTRHEGNAYGLIEALACGVPLITYTTGLAMEMDCRCGVITDDLSPQNWLRLVRDMDYREFKPREWAGENCDYKDFEAKWRKYLGYNA